MPLSVTVSLEPAATPEGQWLTIRARADGCAGTITLPWEGAFQREHCVILEQPSGGTPLSKKAIKKRSTRQERKRIEAVGGRRHAGSGAFAGYKSDGSVGYEWRMENKFTTAQSYRVTVQDLRKLGSECINGQKPVFNIDFQDKHTGVTSESWVLIPFKAWEKLVNASSNKS